MEGFLLGEHGRDDEALFRRAAGADLLDGGGFAIPERFLVAANEGFDDAGQGVRHDAEQEAQAVIEGEWAAGRFASAATSEVKESKAIARWADLVPPPTALWTEKKAMEAMESTERFFPQPNRAKLLVWHPCCAMRKQTRRSPEGPPGCQLPSRPTRELPTVPRLYVPSAELN